LDTLSLHDALPIWTIPVATAPLGVIHHPHRNVVASFDGKGAVKLWT
jgi:hypothetical protein